MELSERHVVVSGTIAGESRATAERKLREAGAAVHSSLSKTTDLLVIGVRPGKTKVDKARERGIEVRPWEEVWDVGDCAACPVHPSHDEDVADAVASVQAEALAPARSVGPMLAKADVLPRGEKWAYEFKWDGLRCVATVRDGRVTMQSRSGKSEYVEQFPKVAAALAKLPDCTIDGELVQLDENGHSFGMGSRNGGGTFLVFDLLDLTGFGDVRGLEWRERRELLETFLTSYLQRTRYPVALSPSFDDPDPLLAYCEKHGLEGIVAKRIDGSYREGARDWIKVKIRNEQEFVVVGWTPGKGQREGGIGGLLLGYYDEDGWIVYAGKTGGKAALDEEFRRRFKPGPEPVWMPDLSKALTSTVTWVEPEVVVQVAFQRWTEDGRLFHPSVQRIRDDKDARDVTRDP